MEPQINTDERRYNFNNELIRTDSRTKSTSKNVEEYGR